jgi:hypothetical protein
MSWFKRHLTCIRAREISDLDNENYKNAVIQSIRNDLKNDTGGLADKKSNKCQNNNSKNSNEFRDYTKNCEGNFLAQTFYNLNVGSEQWLNQRVKICDKKESGECGGGRGWFGRKQKAAATEQHECDDTQCNCQKLCCCGAFQVKSTRSLSVTAVFLLWDQKMQTRMKVITRS